MIRIIKGGLEFQCDTADDIRLALGLLADLQPQPQASLVPDWQVGGPPDVKRVFEVVPDAEDDVVESIAPQHIPVSRRCLDVLEAVMIFTEGVPVRGVCELLGLGTEVVGGRMQMLKNRGLVETVPGHSRSWRATTLARRAKLVAC